MFTLASYEFDRPISLAPMSGVSDLVFRNLCWRYGADYTVSEMVASNPRLRHSEKTQRRLEQQGSRGIRIVQIAGAEPQALAEAARYCVDLGAEVIDINMGCPAKKVCNKLAGSALMRDEALVGTLLEAVVSAVKVPVTLKMRTGWDAQHRNALSIARLAESIGIHLLTIHGRTRACGYKGVAEYDTIAEVKSRIDIPVIANGDIRDAAEARAVFQHTGCDGLMIGRAAYGNPWVFANLKSELAGHEKSFRPCVDEIRQTMHNHVRALHEFYGEHLGSRVARKHVGWYSEQLPLGRVFRRMFNQLDSAETQLALIQNYHNDPQGALAA